MKLNLLAEFRIPTSEAKSLFVKTMQPLIEKAIEDDMKELAESDQMDLLDGFTILEVLSNPDIYNELRKKYIRIGAALPPLVITKDDLNFLSQNSETLLSRLWAQIDEDTNEVKKIYWS